MVAKGERRRRGVRPRAGRRAPPLSPAHSSLFSSLRRCYRKVLLLRFYKGPRLYTLFLVTNNPKVSLQNELCFYLNLAQFRRPPRTTMVIPIQKPSGWRKLQPGVYAKSEAEMKRLLTRFRKGLPVPQAHAKIYREGKRAERRKRR
jgi:hypothetical protein